MTKGVAGFANLSAYKEKYVLLPFLVANGWGAGGRVMPKNSWSSWQEAVKHLLEILMMMSCIVLSETNIRVST